MGKTERGKGTKLVAVADRSGRPLAARTASASLTRGQARRRDARVALHCRRNRKKTQDGRKLRRYKRRWKVERLFAWLGNYRRLVVRYEHHVDNFLGFVRLACILILLRHCL